MEGQIYTVSEVNGKNFKTAVDETRYEFHQ